MSKAGATIARFWRGDVKLPVAFWLGFVFLSAAYASAIAVLGDHFVARADYDPRLIFAFAVTSLGVGAILTVVQGVGVWRAAEKSREAGLAKPLWGFGAQAVVALTAGWLAAVTILSDAPAIAEYGRMAFLDDPGVPPYRLTPSTDGTAIAVAGGFKFGLTRDFAKMAAAMPRLVRVDLESIGGRAGEARHLFDVIRTRRLDTSVTTFCNSACVIAFAGGDHRRLGARAELGFHGPSFPGLLRTNADTAAAAFSAAGFRRGFVEKVLSLPAESLWKPLRTDLEAANVVTRADSAQPVIGGLAHGN